jgi:hypothetical protein
LALADEPAEFTLKTQSLNELSLTVSSYHYNEPSLNVKMDGTNIGAGYLGSYSFGNDWFVLGSIDYNYGPVSYSGTGTQSGIPQYYYNLKAGVGYDFAFNSFALSPYIGIGYRLLSQTWGNTTTSTGAQGYDRQSTYNYIPIGLTHRFAVSEKGKVETTLEYDYLISGNQFSALSSLNGGAVSGLSDSNNQQNTGYGINLTVMYKEGDWGVGPYYKYWNISQSNTNYSNATVNGVPVRYSVYEPANNTNEFGLKVSYRF